MCRKAGFRWLSLFAVFLVGLCIILISCGRKSQKVYRIGILSGLEVFATIPDYFKAAMREIGYKENENIIYDLHEVYTGDADMQKVFDRFVAEKVDLIFTFPTEPAVIAKAAARGTNIPVVFAMGTIEGSNLVKSVRQPGGNITGVRYCGPGLFAKYLEILLELSPSIKRIWITYDPDYPAIPGTLESLHLAASSNKVTLIKVPVKKVAEIEADLAARAKLSDVGIDAILMMPGISHAPPAWAAIKTFAAQHKLPVAGGPPDAADKGETVFTYMPDNNDVSEMAAFLADKILKGIPAGTIPVVTPEPHLRLNYKTAKKLDITIPEGLLNRADEIIR